MEKMQVKLNLATQSPQTGFFPAIGNGLIAGGIAFVCLDGPDKLDFLKPGKVLDSLLAGHLVNVFQSHNAVSNTLR